MAKHGFLWTQTDGRQMRSFVRLLALVVAPAFVPILDYFAIHTVARRHMLNARTVRNLRIMRLHC